MQLFNSKFMYQYQFRYENDKIHIFNENEDYVYQIGQKVNVIISENLVFQKYRDWSKKNISDALSIELSNLEADLKSLKFWVEGVEKKNKNLSKELAAAKRHNNFIYLSREHHLFDVMDEFIKQASNLKKDEK